MVRRKAHARYRWKNLLQACGPDIPWQQAKLKGPQKEERCAGGFWLQATGLLLACEKSRFHQAAGGKQLLALKKQWDLRWLSWSQRSR